MRLLRSAGARSKPPSRRRGETFKFEHSGFKWHATVNRWVGGDVGEVFLSTSKTGTLMNEMARESAMMASMLIQYGCPIDELRSSLARDTGGEPLTPLAHALDMAVRQ